MKLFSQRFLFVLIGMFFTVSLAQAAQQCVSLSGKYQARVDWYNAKDVFIDNSEPWNNKVVIRKSKARGQGRCGPDAQTGRQVCEGFPVKPAQSDKLKPLGKTSSCVNKGGDMFAVTTCLGCTRGNAILSAALGSIANLALPGGAAFQVLGVAADAVGTNTSAATSAILKAAEKSLKVKSKTNVALTIHDVSSLPNAQDIIYVGTPTNIRLGGNFKSAVGHEVADIRNNNESYALSIDCEHSDLDSKITNTSDTITVEWWAGNKKMQESSHFNDIVCSSKERRWTYWYGKKLPQAPTSVVVKTNGKNAFYMDQLLLRLHRDGQILGANLLGSSGAKDGRGWCLSRDPNDINGTFKNYAGSCKSAIKFNVAGSLANRAKTCFNLVQGKVAWNTKGSKLWGKDNLKKFCKGTRNPQKRVSCFDKLVRISKLPWQVASQQCQKY